MGPASFGVAPHQDFIRGVEKDDFGPAVPPFQLGEHTRPVGKEQPLAGVDAQRDTLQCGVARQRHLDHTASQYDRQIIHAVKAEILEHPDGSSPARTGHSGYDKQPRVRPIVSHLRFSAGAGKAEVMSRLA